MNLEKRLRRLREGRITFQQFELETHVLWGMLAGRLFRRWDPGIGVGEEDVRQELLVAAWVHTGKWDPERGVRIDRYVLFNSIDKARKWLDKQRNHAPRLGYTDTIEMEAWTVKAFVGNDDVGLLGAKEMTSGLDWGDRVVLEALSVTRNSEAAATYIYSDKVLRLRYRLGCEAAARRLVRKTAARILDSGALCNLLSEDKLFEG